MRHLSVEECKALYELHQAMVRRERGLIRNVPPPDPRLIEAGYFKADGAMTDDWRHLHGELLKVAQGEGLTSSTVRLPFICYYASRHDHLGNVTGYAAEWARRFVGNPRSWADDEGLKYLEAVGM